MMDDDDDGWFDGGDGDGMHDAVMAGTAYALYRHGQDRQVEQIADLLNNLPAPQQAPPAPPQPPVEPVIHANVKEIDTSLEAWSSFIGQEGLKRHLKVTINSALVRGDRLPHTLLASGFPGVGKTMMSRLIAKAMGVTMLELMPPFDTYTLVEAACQLPDHGILFIDEIHRLADNGKRGAEILLKVLEEGVAYLPDGSQVVLPNITIIGATTDKDKLPETVLDRFKVKPTYAPYTEQELALISVSFALRHFHEENFDNGIAFTVANACRGTPRICDEMVIAHRDLMLSLNRVPTEQELLEFLDTTWDGLSRNHVNYLKYLYLFFGRQVDDEIVYIAGESAIRQMLRETNNGLGRIEAFLLERGFIDRTPRGRQLTPLGAERIAELIEEGHA